VSVPVDLIALRDRLAEYGPHPFLTTVNEDGTPHVTSVTVHLDGDVLVAGAGRRTRRNAADRPSVALLWPTGADPAYSLIVDAVAVVADDDESEEVRMTPHAAILHRVAGAHGEGPNCVAVDGGPPS
jgi:hypothetical protein